MGGQAKVDGARYVIDQASEAFPEALRSLHEPPERLYVVGDPGALQEGLAVVGARKATPYGIGCAARFAGIAAGCGVAIVSGGARGCDSEAHRAAIRNGARTVSFLGGGCDCVYPAENLDLFRQIVGAGGALASEQPWDSPPLPWMFRARNRLIAGLAKATLIVEAGLPSGTFSTADEALAANREVLVVPGAITSRQSLGANRLICQGATPVVDDETFHDALFSIFGVMSPVGRCTKDEARKAKRVEKKLLAALDAEQLTLDGLLAVANDAMPGADRRQWLMMWLANQQRDGRIARYPGGRYGSTVPGS